MPLQNDEYDVNVSWGNLPRQRYPSQGGIFMSPESASKVDPLELIASDRSVVTISSEKRHFFVRKPGNVGSNWGRIATSPFPCLLSQGVQRLQP
jgi:hypothetical protein